MGMFTDILEIFELALPLANLNPDVPRRSYLDRR
jgi:hypothetical protein